MNQLIEIDWLKKNFNDQKIWQSKYSFEGERIEYNYVDRETFRHNVIINEV